MAEVPSVLFNLGGYAALGIAGISIGSNDLTQLLLGADRDNEVLAETFDERDPAVDRYLRQLIPERAPARPAHLDLRPGALGAPRVRGPARRVRASTRSRSTSTSIDRARALSPPPSGACCCAPRSRQA